MKSTGALIVLAVIATGLMFLPYGEKSQSPGKSAGQSAADISREGIALFKHGDFEKAIDCFSRVIARNPRDSQARPCLLRA